jgi:hypothetical protein
MHTKRGRPAVSHQGGVCNGKATDPTSTPHNLQHHLQRMVARIDLDLQRDVVVTPPGQLGISSHKVNPQCHQVEP